MWTHGGINGIPQSLLSSEPKNAISARRLGTFKIEAKHKTTTTTLGTQLLGVILQGTSHVVQLLSTKLKQGVTKNQVGTTFNAIRSKDIKSYLQFWFQSRLDLHPIKVKLNCVEVGSKKCAFEFQASFSFSSCSARTCQVAASEALCCGSSHLHHKVQTSSCRLWNTCCRNMSQLIVPCCLSPSEILPLPRF